MPSSSLPKKEKRHARSSRWAGQSSRLSPRTRKEPRWNACVVAPVLLRDEVGHDLALVVVVAGDQVLGHRRVGLDRADAVDAGDGGDDDDVVAFQQRPGGGVPHPVDLLVYLQLLLDVGVRAGDVGLGLVVVVVGDEVLDRVLGEELLELAVELRGERLVRGKDDGGALRLLDDLGHGVGLAGAGGAEQDLVSLAAGDALGELGDGGGLVARRLELGVHDESLAAFELWAGQDIRAGGERVGGVVRHLRSSIRVLMCDSGAAGQDR